MQNIYLIRTLFSSFYIKFINNMGFNTSKEVIEITPPPTTIVSQPPVHTTKKTGKGNPRKSINYESSKEINKSLKKSLSPTADKNIQRDTLKSTSKQKDIKNENRQIKGLVQTKYEPVKTGSRFILPNLQKKSLIQNEFKIKRSLTVSKKKIQLFEIQKNPQDVKINQESHTQKNKNPQQIVRKKEYTLQNLIEKYQKQEKKNQATLKNSSIFNKTTTRNNKTDGWRNSIKISDTPNLMASSTTVTLKKSRSKPKSPSKPKSKKKQLNPIDLKLGALVKIYALDS